MGRWWLFNPYDRSTHKAKHQWCPWSVRVHHIMPADQDRDLHNHPWNARTAILDGWYIEQCLADDHLLPIVDAPPGAQVTEFIKREAGDTAALRHGEYHRIDQVSPGGVWTLFVTSPWQGEWDSSSLARRCTGGSTPEMSNDQDEPASKGDGVHMPLMTIAQHERILRKDTFAQPGQAPQAWLDV